MTTKKVTTKRGGKGKAEAAELDALARHISEALRIMRDSELIPARNYNHFADAWNELCGLSMRDTFVHSEEYARLILAELAKEGGAR